MITSVPTHSEKPVPVLRSSWRSSWLNVATRPIFVLCALLGILLLAGLVVVMVLGALGSFGQTKGPAVSLADLTGTTILTALVALVFTVPIGLFAALYLSEFASPRVRGWLDEPLRFLAHVPPVVYGYFAVTVFLPALGRFVPALQDQPALNAGLALAGMLVPVFLEKAQAAIAAVPQHLRDAACALGGGKLTTAWFVVVPAARARLLAGLVLAASRAVGEAMIVLVVFTAQTPQNATRPETLTTFFVPNEAGLWAHQVPKEFFLVGCVLLVLAFVLDTTRLQLEHGGDRP